MADMPERMFTPEELAAERARVALEWQLPQAGRDEVTATQPSASP